MFDIKLQRKPLVSRGKDRFEREADRVADSVVARASPVKPGCACGGVCASCQDKSNTKSARRDEVPAIQRMPAASMPESARAVAPPSVSRTLGKDGAPLPPVMRSDLERHLRHDLSRVRVHTDADAARSARDVQARAYTVGSHVVFGANQYSPATPAGKRLLAHELTHVVQQGGASGGKAAQPVLQREPLESKRRGGTLPYREATELNKCVEIMGSENLEFCQREVTGEQVSDASLAVRAQRVRRDLDGLVAGAVWKEIRKRAYPRESAAGVRRAHQRKQRQLSDLTGLGSIASLESFATGVRDLQRGWRGLSVDQRVKKVGEVSSRQLQSVGVPGFLDVRKEATEFKASFQRFYWRFNIGEDLVKESSLDDKNAGELANSSLHEARHAEQAFLAARLFAAIRPDATDVANQVKVPASIAQKAVDGKFDARTPADVAALGQRMYDAGVTNRAANQRISNDDGLAELAVLRKEAEEATAALSRAVTPETYANAVAKRNALRLQIIEVEKLYKDYRNIPYEADAHEVGDAAEEAFKGWK